MKMFVWVWVLGNPISINLKICLRFVLETHEKYKMNNLRKTIFKHVFTAQFNSIRLLGRAFKDPGIKHRSKILHEEPELSEVDMDELEADFHQVGKSQKQHQLEMEAFKEKEKYHIVKHKYFREKYPNYLTWADKQQIKVLHSTDPEEWTVEKLSEGFPALPDTILKITRNNWIPKNANRVKHHDQAVQQNWLEFKKGNVQNLPLELQQHLSKFSSRELNLNTDLQVTTQQDILKRKIIKEGGEFSQIIQSYQRLKEKQAGKSKEEEKTPMLSWDGGDQTNIDLFTSSQNIKKKKKDKRLFTYSELEISQQQNVPSTEISSTLSSDNESSPSEITLTHEDFKTDIAKFKDKSSHVNLYNPERNYSNLMYPERIIIPKDKLKRGCTYKLNDCYYDSDGEFLYRVPGLT